MRNKLLLALLSVLMLSLGWLGVSGLPMLGALVPLLVISGGEDGSRRGFWRMFGWCALAFGLWSGATTWWVWNAAAIGAILSVVITIVLMGGVMMLYHYVSKRAHKALAYVMLIAAWIAAEYAYTVGQISFPWLTLGNGFASDTTLVQWYDTTGVFGGSLWVLLCNILIYECFVRRSVHKIAVAAAVVVLPLGISLVRYYTYHSSDREQITVTVVQPNIDPYKKSEMPPTEQINLMLSLMQEAPKDVNYIITPETALTQTLREDMLEVSRELAGFRALTVRSYPQAQIMLGATTRQYYFGAEHSATAHNMNDEFWYDNYNSVLAVDSSSQVQLRHKSLLVIGVEKVPYYNLLKNIEFLVVDLGGTTGQLGVDPEPKVFRSPAGHVSGTAVCWEGIFGGYMGGFVTRGAQILFVISNDGWWGDTPGYRQLFAFSRLRAIELRRAIARSANTGISGLIDDRGRVLQKLDWDKRGTLSGQLPLNDKITFYARYGDYIARIAMYVFVLCLLYFVAYRIRRRDHLVK